MCTVTYIPTAGGFHLTSNRDENAGRMPALKPVQYAHNGNTLIYPKDPQAGGTWISAKETGEAAVLLNGAFVKHHRQLLYRKSRGLIFLELFECDHPPGRFYDIQLDGIEPFTFVYSGRNELHELRWDGSLKHHRLLDINRSHIWSSATLYDEEAAGKRSVWFEEWLSSGRALTTAKIMNFHQFAGADDQQEGLVINRNNKMRTVSITSISVYDGTGSMCYRDLQTDQHCTQLFADSKRSSAPGVINRISMSLRRIKIRLFNWEYWPFWAVYGPMLVYWLWLSLRARSFFFFSAANPGIAYAGFVQERKSDIYKIMPDHLYPATKRCRPGQHIRHLSAGLKKAGLNFPLIAKPDIGQKGILVQLLHDETQLRQYNEQINVDFLIQEYIPYELEAGIFYHRMPGETRGKISGIVGKEFLSITGDGRSTVEMLLKKDGRSFLQLASLERMQNQMLSTVLPEGVQQIIVPYGNHSRGAKFIDLNHRITDQLICAIDDICRQIPGFNYGRLDIRFNSWEELSEGKKLSIIEVNGAGSEPTHIYDPSHSLLYAWKEIARHWGLMYEISMANAKRGESPLLSTVNGIRLIRDHYKYLRQIRPA